MSATWIWYPGDYEIYLGNRIMERREQQGKMIASAWRVDMPYPSVFYKHMHTSTEEESIEVYALGEVTVRAEGDHYIDPVGHTYLLPPGEYEINITVYNPGGLPALFVDGAYPSGKGWKVSAGWFGYENKEAAFSDFNEKDEPPLSCRFSYQTEYPVCEEAIDGGVLYDFGRETFGYLTIGSTSFEGNVKVYYGESREEALDREFCETSDVIPCGKEVSICPASRAMRYAAVMWNGKERGEVSLKAELLPVSFRGDFSCENEEINAIYKVAYRTLHLCTRETFLDGIKRDRWYWSGDATQSYLMNFYSFFDTAVNERTMWAIRGKDPMEAHLNLILDYSFYWVISLYDHYLYTGDAAFLQRIFPRAETLMAFCETKCDADGFAVGKESDWVFLDWADMDMSGEVAAEQILFWKSYTVMSELSRVLFGEDEKGYGKKAEVLKEKIMNRFWDEKRGVFIHSVKDGKPTEKLTRYAGIFALLYGFCEGEMQEKIVSNMLLSESIMKIKTPYMRFYELSALLLSGKGETVLSGISDYWGGMLRLGATSFWEEYDPTATDHLSMYGRPYSKSLCHAWGAGPLYLFGRYFLGVYPTAPGYKTYEVAPNGWGLSEFCGTVPTPSGDIKVKVSGEKVEVLSQSDGVGTLLWHGKRYSIEKGKNMEIL